MQDVDAGTVGTWDVAVRVVCADLVIGQLDHEAVH